MRHETKLLSENFTKGEQKMILFTWQQNWAHKGTSTHLLDNELYY